MNKALCVYCSSSSAVDPKFFKAAEALGEAMVKHGYAFVYGGASVGLMGALAASVHQHGGKVIGVIPERLHGMGITYDVADELIVTEDMRDRKATMESRATAFVGFPGGFGTLEEIFEILTLKQLGYHDKALVLLNVDGFFDPLIELMEHIYRERFAKEAYREMYHVANSVEDLFAYLENYQPPVGITKW